MIEYLILILAIPLGLLLAQTTNWEAPIYKSQRYFPTIKKILLILIAITISQDRQLFFASLFTLITVHVWHKTKPKTS